MNYFAGKVVLITGAGSGIGRQLALRLAAEEAAVAAVDICPEPLTTLADELKGKRYAGEIADVCQRSALSDAVVSLGNQLGPIDLLIANAGIGMENSALAFCAADFEAQIRVNLIGVANSVEAVLPSMLERRQGHIVIMSSLASYRGLPKMLGYCASKAGVRAFAEGLRVELRDAGIAVTTLCPGWIRTPMTAHIQLPKPHLMELPDAVERMVEAIRRRRDFYAFPTAAAWRVRVLRWLPCSISDRLTAWLLRRLARTQ
jgi:NAD(P)-dependent dehydrogenase (short-subunit alcohol dehydrogenase family)